MLSCRNESRYSIPQLPGLPLRSSINALLVCLSPVRQNTFTHKLCDMGLLVTDMQQEIKGVLGGHCELVLQASRKLPGVDGALTACAPLCTIAAH